MATLHVLTAVSRPEHLARIAGSLAYAAGRSPFAIVWHWRYDLERQNIGGQAVKNAMLDEIEGGLVWILDDDTLVVSTVLERVAAELESEPELEAVVVSQWHSDPPRILEAGAERVHPGQIDIGQAFISRELIGERRIPETYEGDGEFLELVLAGARVAYLADTLSIHNAIVRR